MSEINEGVRLMVERMKTNPEEFIEGSLSKWSYAINMASGAKWLTEEERKLLDDAADVLNRERFTAEVLKTLTTTDEQRAENAKVDAWRIGARTNVVTNHINHQLTGNGGGITGAVLTANTAGTAMWNGTVPNK